MKMKMKMRKTDMYSNVKYLGKTLAEWQKILHNVFSIGELYRMSKQNIDFNRL